eukprot:235770-Pelagomonas_calceolata.AAC.1
MLQALALESRQQLRLRKSKDAEQPEAHLCLSVQGGCHHGIAPVFMALQANTPDLCSKPSALVLIAHIVQSQNTS